VFIDADKENYVNYYEATLPLLAPNGLIVADNVLWRGRVLAPENDEDQAVIDFAAHVQRDPRVLNVLLTAGDGLMLIRTR
jgi:caffeoyl-CoA O-methyltransferase